MSLPSVVFQSPSSVHVWWIDLTRIGDEEDVLSPEERQRAARLRQPRDRARWVAARGALRRILAGYAGVAPRELRLENGPHGKPAIGGGSPVCFSLSHAGGRAVLAVAWQREVGVDLEPSDPPLPDEDLQRLITTICTADEARELDALPPTDRRETFLRFWTLKEAYLKGVGVGLTREPRTVEVGIGHDCSRPLTRETLTPTPLPVRWARGRPQTMRQPGSHRGVSTPSPVSTGEGWGEGLPGRGGVEDQHAVTEAPHWTLRLLDTGPCWVAALAVAGTEFELEEFHWPPLPVSLAAQTD